MADGAHASALADVLNPGKETTPTAALTLSHPSHLSAASMSLASVSLSQSRQHSAARDRNTTLTDNHSTTSTTPQSSATMPSDDDDDAAAAAAAPSTAATDCDVPMNPTHALVHEASTIQHEQQQQQQPQFSAGLSSPCFVHSYLDKGVTLSESLKKQRARLSKTSQKSRHRSARARQGQRPQRKGSATQGDSTSSCSEDQHDVDETPTQQVAEGNEASYFDPATYGLGGPGPSPASSSRPAAPHPAARPSGDDDAQSSSDATTTEDRRVQSKATRPASPRTPSDMDDDGFGSLDDRDSSYDSSYDYSNEDEDKVRSLTHQLAETAVGVREMSKQLGRARVKSTIHSVLIITKARDNHLIKLTRELAIWLMATPRNGKDTGLIVYVDSQLQKSKRFDAEGIKRDYPKLFDTKPKRTASISSSLSSASGYDSSSGFPRQEGKLRYWTSDMCSRSPHLFDFVVTLGGDGTVLFCSWLFQRIVPPVLPFALGSLGFLTNFDFARYKEVMTSALDDGIRVNLRMRFTATIYRATLPSSSSADRYRRRAIKSGKTGEIIMRNVKNCGWDAIESPNPSSGERPRSPEESRDSEDELDDLGQTGAKSKRKKGKKKCRDKEIMCFSTRPVETFEVLNDLVVDRGPSPYVSLLEVFGDEHHMTTAQADGLCISTPTGSTAYSLSAGGSLVHPEIPAILISPICPHTLSFRPMLLPDSMELRIAVPYNSRSTAWASFDGRGRVELKQGDHIKVTASRYPFPTVCAENQSTDWFSSISRTLKWNERQRQKSFVVVEEGHESESLADGERGKGGSRSGASKGVAFTKHGADDDSDSDEDGESEDEDEEDEAEHFDIDDTSTTVTRSNSPVHSGASTPAERRRQASSSSSGGGDRGGNGSGASSLSRAASVGGGSGSGLLSRRTSGQGILPTNANGVPRLTPLTSTQGYNNSGPSSNGSGQAQHQHHHHHHHGHHREGSGRGREDARSRPDSALNSPDRFAVQGPPLPPKALSERHLLNADFRLDDPSPHGQRGKGDRPRKESERGGRRGDLDERRADRGSYSGGQLHLRKAGGEGEEDDTPRSRRAHKGPMTPSSALARDKTPTGLPLANERRAGGERGSSSSSSGGGGGGGGARSKVKQDKDSAATSGGSALGGGTALVVYGEDDSDSDSTQGAG